MHKHSETSKRLGLYDFEHESKRDGRVSEDPHAQAGPSSRPLRAIARIPLRLRGTERQSCRNQRLLETAEDWPRLIGRIPPRVAGGASPSSLVHPLDQNARTDVCPIFSLDHFPLATHELPPDDKTHAWRVSLASGIALTNERSLRYETTMAPTTSCSSSITAVDGIRRTGMFGKQPPLIDLDLDVFSRTSLLVLRSEYSC